MIRKQFIKAVMLGLCMASLSTGNAFAMEVVKEAPAVQTEEISLKLQELYDRQEEIDKILFEEHAKDMEEMGFIVSSTGVLEDAIEISITPYEEKFADYIYELVGKDGIKVTEMDQSILYATGVAPDQAVADTAEAEVITDQEATAVDADLADNSGVAIEDEKLEIQIESANNPDNEAIDEETAPVNDEIRTLSITADEKEGVSAPVIILLIAGVAVLVGVTVILSLRKKNMK
jgi:hypothetical protein